MDDNKKRKAPGAEDQANKKSKKSWYSHSSKVEERSIKPGDSGIWVTCHRGKERKCIGELRDLFAEFTNGEDHETKAGDATELNGTAFSVDDIEKDIRSEIADIRKPAKNSPITPIWTDVPCLVFFRTSAPVDPVTLVQEVMRNAAKDPTRKRTRCTQRFTPNSVLGYASEEGLDQVAREVLAPHFHTDLVVPKKFAIRPTMRNHSTMKRDDIIKQVASIVGTGHSVDLKNYDLLILVDVVKNVCGVCVVDAEYDRLKRYNLQEIFEPSRQEQQYQGNPE